jgi:hypothetical protein
VPVPLGETDELEQVVAVPLDRPRTSTGDLERGEVFVNQRPQPDLINFGRRRFRYGSHVCSSK